MGSVENKLFLLPTLLAGLGLLLAAPAEAQYTFGSQVQSTNAASITYNSGTGAFQYTDTSNLSADFAALPLAGNAAAFITATNGWAASLTANLSARSMPGDGPYAAMGLYIIVNNNFSNIVEISLSQENYTGMGGGNFYGTEVYFEALTNGQNLATTPLGSSSYNGGTSYQLLSEGTSSTPVTESISAASGALTFTNDAATDILTGYYNGSPVGSISLASWGPNPSLALAVVGFSGYGINVPAGTDSASNFYAVRLPLKLTLIHLGGNVILAWPTNAVGFTLESTANLTPPAVWTPVSPAPVVINTNNVVTNVISGTQQFFRLTNP